MMQSSGHLLSNQSNTNAINSTHNNQNFISLSNSNSVNSNQIENGISSNSNGKYDNFPHFPNFHLFNIQIPPAHFSQPTQGNFPSDYQNSLLVHSQTGSNGQIPTANSGQNHQSYKVEALLPSESHGKLLQPADSKKGKFYYF